MRNPLQKLSGARGALPAPADNWAVKFSLLLMQERPLVASSRPTKAEGDGVGGKGSHLPRPGRTVSSVLFGSVQDKLQEYVMGCSEH